MLEGNLFDNMNKIIGNQLNKLSYNNYIKIFDSPHIWGEGFNKDIMPSALKRTEELEKSIKDIISETLYRCDIATLIPPDNYWCEVIIKAIDDCLKKKLNRKIRPQIRLLFGICPEFDLKVINKIAEILDLELVNKYVKICDYNYLNLKKQINKLIKYNRSTWEVYPEIWIGRYCINDIHEEFFNLDFNIDNLDFNIDNLDFNIDNLVSNLIWNHAKIIAVDGIKSFVGGHNLISGLYNNYPPVHDISVEVHGSASLDAQKFLNNMWTSGDKFLKKEHLNIYTLKWKEDKDLTDPLADENIKKEIIVNQQKILCPSDNFFKKSSRILSVGKFGKPLQKKRYQNDSDLIREFLIKNAKKNIKISQQDLINPFVKKWDDHDVCKWIIETLIKNTHLKVYIVLSPIGAGSNGEIFSFGCGAKHTFNIFKYHINKKKFDINHCLQRIKIAPFFYTNKVPDISSHEGKTYIWPEQDLDSYVRRLQIEDIDELKNKNIPRISFFDSIKKYPSAPANHAKVIIIDDEIYSIGSDNLYPNYLSEFNYIVEGKDAVNNLIKNYWDPLWKYSSPYSLTGVERF